LSVGHHETSKDAERQSTATESATFEPALVVIVDAWDRLPEAVRAGIVAMVKASDQPIK
jgi:hypothetical protein